LIHTDMLHESALMVLRDHPLETLKIPFCLAKGKAYLKQKLASLAHVDAGSLPYNGDLLRWLKSEKTSGRKLVLCTASDHSIATSIAEHLDIFDEVIASDGKVNLAGVHKAEALESRFGRAGFDYVGNSSADIPVWERARRAVVVNAPGHIEEKAKAVCEVERVFPQPASGLSVWRRVLRMHQWLKNLLLFVPMLAAHQVSSSQMWVSLFLAFMSFSLCASSVYITNDLLDLESDRLHPRKRNRPFASGQVATWKGVVLAPLLLILSFAVGTTVSSQFMATLLVYFLLTCAYSLFLKQLMLVDCLALAILYTLRLVAGAAATGQALTFWILAFSVFLFLSLAFVKRYAEIVVTTGNKPTKIHGRGYITSDAPLVEGMGLASGYASVLVLALYLNSSIVVTLYRNPEVIWGAVLVMLFWINWMWVKAHRGQMDDDPLVYALKDKASLFCATLFTVILAVGSIGFSW
jgi:4-hydroxybenzoate polyprenyltransferase